MSSSAEMFGRPAGVVTQLWPGATRAGDQITVPAVMMRGGTSRGIIFAADDLPPDESLRDRVILAIYGSPDARQIDGVGGGHPLTSKMAIVSKSRRRDADIDYLFGQVRVDEAHIDYSGNCGNMLSAVGPFAIDTGLIRGREPVTRARIHVVNTGQIIVADIPVRDGFARATGDTSIAGVPGSGALISLDFADSGSTLGRGLLPTGLARESLPLSGGKQIDVSLIDAGNASVFVAAGAAGLEMAGLMGRTLPPDVIRLLEDIRAHAAVRLGLVGRPEDAPGTSPALPKVYVVAAPFTYMKLDGEIVEEHEVSLVGRGLAMGVAHPAYAITAGICTAAAARIPGTVVSQAADQGSLCRIGHPSGCLAVEIEVDVSAPGAPSLRVARVERTARRMMSGVAYVQSSVLQ
jgi:methylitaconate Delta-isomerase